MRKILFYVFAAMLVLSLCLCGCTSDGYDYPGYSADKTSGNDDFDSDSNSFAADVILDGYLTDERYTESDVISLGSWDDSDVENQVFGAIVNDVNDYANTKRAIIKMFRGEIGLHFGFEVKDSDLAYSSLEDGDPAIWTDNILVNLCTAIDGAEVPMSDDYYLMVTAFGNYCFRRGANAAGMWGAWSGILDYQAAIHKDGDTITGFGVELVVPYAQIGITKNDPVGVTFRSCDRSSANGVMTEREWLYGRGVHHFNRPNDYVIWGEDNVLYAYYDYRMPDVTIKGTVTDAITNMPLGGVTVADGIVSQENGEFTVSDVNANVDYIFEISDERIIGTQTYVVDKNVMRAKKGGMVAVSISLLTKENKITQKITGQVDSIASLGSAFVKAGESTARINADGTYEIECTFEREVMPLEFYLNENAPAFETEIYLTDAIKGKITVDAEIPLISELPSAFGAEKSAKAFVGWCADGLFVRITTAGTTNGFGVALSADEENGKVVLYHTFGTMCITDFVSQSWNYAAPSAFGSVADIHKNAQGLTAYTFTVPYSVIGTSEPEKIRVAPFEYASSGAFEWYTDEDGTAYPFGNIATLKYYPVLNKDATVEFTKPETTTSSYNVTLSGKTNAKVLLERVEGRRNGIKITIDYTAAQGFWGFGVMLGNFESGAGITQLYVPGYGTIDHRAYGDWNWAGNYQPAASLGVEAAETVVENVSRITLFYSYETLCGEKYGLNITAGSKSIGVQFFEYVTDASGNLYGSYNCVISDGSTVAFDTGVANFLKWQFVKSEEKAIYEYNDLGESVSKVTVTVLDDGVKFTFVSTETANTFGYGVCLQAAGGNAISVLYATTGNMAKQSYGDWAWGYNLPTVYGITASRTTVNGETISEFFIPNGVLGVESVTELKFCLFETVKSGGSQYGIYNCCKNGETEIAIDGGTQNFLTVNVE